MNKTCACSGLESIIQLQLGVGGRLDSCDTLTSLLNKIMLEKSVVMYLHSLMQIKVR